MNALRDTLEALLAPVVNGLGYELWELEWSGGGRSGGGVLRLFIDAAEPVTVEDCERVSRAVSAALDETDPVPGEYTLEVSSPGLERPLRTAAHFARFVGQPVFVELAVARDGRKRHQGRLVAADARQVELEIEGQRVALPIEGLRKAHLVAEY
jgi:ribosome maturation factor RimP